MVKVDYANAYKEVLEVLKNYYNKLEEQKFIIQYYNYL